MGLFAAQIKAPLEILSNLVVDTGVRSLEGERKLGDPETEAEQDKLHVWIFHGGQSLKEALDSPNLPAENCVLEKPTAERCSQELNPTHCGSKTRHSPV